MTTSSAKPKRQPHLLRQILNAFLPLHFEFETPLTPEECISKLKQSMNYGSFFHADQHSFRSWAVTNSTKKYFLFAQRGGALVEASGTIQVRANLLTYVSGVVKPSRLLRGFYWAAVGYILFISLPALLRNASNVLSEFASPMALLIVYFTNCIFSSFKGGELIDQIESLILSDEQP
jgi:hypothetical protein